MSLDELRNSVKEERAAADAVVLRRQTVENSIALLDREEAEFVLCPICETEHRRSDLESTLQQINDKISPDTTSRLSQLEAQLTQSEGFNREVQKLQGELPTLSKRKNTFRTLIDAAASKELTEPVSTDNIKALMDSLSAHKSSIEVQIDNQKGWFKRKTEQNIQNE